RLITDLIRISMLRRKSERISVQGVNCFKLHEDQAPFSFFHWIFINPDNHSASEQQEIITHELSHARQHHSLDVIISELFCIVLWINPFAWLLAREIRQNLEYLADQNVLEAGFNPKNYQYHLLGLTYTKAAAKLYNNFNVLPLKNRIRMMNKKRTSRAFSIKYALFAPLAFALLFVSNIELIAREANNWMETQPTLITEDKASQEKIIPSQLAPEVEPESQKTTPAKTIDNVEQQRKGINDLKGKPVAVKTGEDQKVDPKNQTFTVVEQMPQFPGGDKALQQFLRDNVKYPEAEAKKGIQGRVIVVFIINKEGKVTDPTIVRGVDPALDNEALRVINSMPLWIPGVQRGVPVNVKYTVPVNFRLDKDGKPDLSYPDRRIINLMIVDGKEYTRAQFDEMAKGKDPKWIKNINILKPEEAIKLYGEKAKDGAIVITTNQ
ncbi:MAG: TonB family protein, partial [Bacteroidales bacterium]